MYVLFDPPDVGLGLLSKSGYHLGGKQLLFCREAFQLDKCTHRITPTEAAWRNAFTSLPNLDLASEPGATRI